MGDNTNEEKELDCEITVYDGSYTTCDKIEDESEQSE
jgi:hypothetical protein